MTNRERKEAVRERVLEGLLDTEVYSVCSNTFVRVVSIINGTSYDAVGFSKVRWPDTWDINYGIRIAASKAIMRIVRAVIRKQDISSHPVFLPPDTLVAIVKEDANG